MVRTRSTFPALSRLGAVGAPRPIESNHLEGEAEAIELRRSGMLRANHALTKSREPLNHPAMMKPALLGSLCLTLAIVSGATTGCSGNRGDGGNDQESKGSGGVTNPAEEGPPELTPAEDTDGDGLTNGDEGLLGTSPLERDTDHDGYDDALEVGMVSAPNDTDADGIIDALENELLDFDVDGLPDTEDQASGWQLVVGGFTPFAVKNDGTETTRLEVRLAGAASVTSVQVGVSMVYRLPTWLEYDLLVDGQNLASGPIDLFDDGTHGDLFPGDGVFSRNEIAVSGSIASERGQIGSIVLNELRVTDASGEVTRVLNQPTDAGNHMVPNQGFSLGLVEPQLVVGGSEVEEGVVSYSHCINVVSPKDEVDVRRLLIGDGLDNGVHARSVLERIDGTAVDFLYTFPGGFAVSRLAGAGTAIGGPVTGTGITGAPSVSGFPQARVHAALDVGVAVPLLHETLHGYANHLPVSFGFGEGFSTGHWGTTSVGGVLGGFDPATFVDNGNGTFTTGAFSPEGMYGWDEFVAPLELYFMGLSAPDEVQPLIVLRNAVPIDYPTPETVTISAEMSTVTIDEIVATVGALDPPYPQAKSTFTAAFVVLSRRILTASEMAMVNLQAKAFSEDSEDFGHSLGEATEGRASLVTYQP